MKLKFSSLLRALILPVLSLCMPVNSFAYEGELRIGTEQYYIINSAEVEYVCNFDSNLTELIIPETVTYEGITYTVTSVGQFVLLSSADVTTKVVIPPTVKKIRAGAFGFAKALTELTIPSSVEEIEDYIFYNGNGVKKLIIEQYSSKPIITSAHAFESDNLEEVFLGRNLVYPHNEDIYSHPVADDRVPMFSPNLKKLTLGQYATRISFKDTYLIKNSSSTFINTTEQVYPFGEQPLLEELIFTNGSPKNCYTGDFKNWGVKNISIEHCYVYAKNLDGSTVSPSPFSELSNLKKVTFATGYSSGFDVTARLFEGCKSLEILDLGTIANIREKAFLNCTGLKSVTLPSYLYSIESQAFQGCSNLKNVVIEESANTLTVGSWPLPNSVETLYVGRNLSAAYLFSHTYPNDLPNVTSLTIGNKVTKIADKSFSGVNKLTQLDIPASVISIGENAFKYCSSLTDLTIPASVNEIKANAFAEAVGLKKLRFNDGASSINLDINAFQNASNIESVYVGRDIVNSNSSNSSSFSGMGKITDVEFGANVTTVPKYLFKSCVGITALSIPGSVNLIGENAFRDCSIAQLTIEDSEDALTSAGEAFAGNPVESLYLGRNADLSFADSETLASVTFGDNVTSVANNAFSGCKLLTEITFPQNLTAIGDNAFHSCDGLKALTIPASIATIGENAFRDCSIAQLTIEDSEDALTSAGEAFAGNPVESLYLGRNADLSFADSETLASVTFGDNVTTVANNAFSGCKLLTEITFPQKLTAIGDNAFNGCDGLKALTIPASIATIGENAFRDCSIAQLTIEDSEDALTSAGEAFAGNPVESLYLGRDADLSFADSETLSSVTFGDNVTSVANNAFSGCKLLTEITFPQNLTAIGDNAFNGCDGLTQLTLPASLQSIGEFAFDGCSAIEEVKVNAINPPAAETTTFAPETYSTALLTVPEEAVADYRTHDVWSLFTNGNHLEGNGEGDDDENTSGIGSVTDFDDNEIVEVYNLSGTMVARSVKNLSPGFYIVKSAAKVTKIHII